MAQNLTARLGISPIAWWNDDLPQLSERISLEEMLAEAAEAGYSGVETGRRFPTEARELLPLLDQHGLSICGGWFSGELLHGDLSREIDRIAPMIELFRAAEAPCIIYGETAASIQGDRTKPLASKVKLDEAQIRRYGRQMTEFGEYCAEAGMPLSYHHHMAAVIETEAELDRFASQSGEGIPLLLDCGHMAFAGGDPLSVLRKHHRRISHIHAKDLRKDVVAGLNRNQASFLDAVLQGAFTVPGDGDLDFAALTLLAAELGYNGWFVVEAEQDPKSAPPREMAHKGHAELTSRLTNAGYTILA